MIDRTQLEDARQAIEDLLEDCHGFECNELAESLERALDAMASYRRAARRRAAGPINIQIEHTQ